MLKEFLYEIAQTIRGYIGSDEKINAQDFPVKIGEVRQAGFDQGYVLGHNDGYAQSEDDFWDGIQDGGERTNYEYAFQYWGSKYIRPKHKVCLGSATTTSSATGKRPLQMFLGCSNLKIIEKEYFDFSQYNLNNGSGTYGNYAIFRACTSLEEIQDIGLNPNGLYYQTFNGCRNLKKIEIMRVDESTTFSGVFTSCAALENITIEGIIGQDGFDVSPCTNLTKKSIISIVSALSETLTDIKKITLPSIAVNKYFKSADGKEYTSEWIELIKPKKNWDFAFE